MKKFKKIVLILLFVIAVVALSLFIYLQTTKPQYEGEVSIKNISK